jgi:hypothetical protein
VATDHVTRVEERVRTRINLALDRAMRNVRQRYNRPIFSEKVPEDVQFNEFMLMKDDPQIMAQFLRDQKASSLRPAAEYFKHMMSKMDEG